MFKLGDRVIIINRELSNMTGGLRWYTNVGDSIGIKCYICLNNDNSYSLRENENGTGDYYGLLSKKYSKGQFNECDLKLVTPQEINYEIY